MKCPTTLGGVTSDSLEGWKRKRKGRRKSRKERRKRRRRGNRKRGEILECKRDAEEKMVRMAE